MLSEENINKLLNNIDNNIKYIESDINRGIVNDNTMIIYDTLNSDRKTFYGLKLNTPEYMELKKKYGYQLLRMKKELISYYNKKLIEIKVRLNNIINELKFKNDAILLDTFKSMKLPEFMSTINNFQNNININDLEEILKREEYIDSIEKKYNISWNKNISFGVNYLERYELNNIEENINKYLNGVRGISKQSLKLDIELTRNHIRDLEKDYKNELDISNECLRLNNKLDELANKLNKKKTNNTEKQYLKNKTDELNNETTTKEEHKEIKKFRIEKIEDVKELYQKYDKPVLFASGIATMALLNTTVGPILIPTIIFANIILSAKYSIIDKISEILAKAINAIKDESGNFIKNNKVMIGINDAYSGLLKSVASLKVKSSNVITELVNKIKESRVVVRTNQHINNIKDKIDTKKNENLDLRTTKIYYEYILSGKSLEDFCKDKNLSDDIFNNLVEFIEYKDKGRSK